MSHSALSPGPITRSAIDLAPRAWVLALTGLLTSGASMLMPWPLAALAVLILGLTLGAVAVIALGVRWRYRQAREALFETIAAFVAEDAAPSLTTDMDGEVGYANRAARDRFRAEPGQTLTAVLGHLFAQPASVLYRLQNRALALGAAREEVPCHGKSLLIAVHRVGSDGFLWRVEDMTGQGAGRDANGISVPMMTLSRTGSVLSMNDALRAVLGGREMALDRIFTDLPLRNGEIHIVQAAQGTLPVQVVIAELAGGLREVLLIPDPRRRVTQANEWSILENLPIPLIKVSRDGCVEMASARARRLMGDQDLVGRRLSECVEGLGRPVADWLADAWSGRNLGRTETVRVSRRPEETYLQIAPDVMRDESGDALVIVMTDATELKSLETQFVQSQKMQAIGQLAGGVAHDFNNLLTAISGHCDLLLLRHDERDSEFADLTQISQNANRAAALVSQLLAFSRKQTLKPDVIDLAEVVVDLAHLLGRLVGERVKLDVQQDSDIRHVRADKRQFEQVIMNLVVNARDAMPSGGRIRLEVRNLCLEQALDRDRVRVPPGDYVTVSVIDEGTGIPQDRLTKIFEPFFTTKGPGKGTGLGLSMAYGIVKQSGGYIFVDSIERTGTTFSVFLPVYHALKSPQTPVEDRVLVGEPAASAQDIGPALPGPLPAHVLPKPTHDPAPVIGGHVLLVEDEAPVRAFATRALRLRGYTVTEAENAEMALKLLEDPALVIDVVVTDVVMPGMDGPSWVIEALKQRPGVKVVVVSGYAEESISEHRQRIPNSVFLPKPFSLSELTATVSAQIH